MGLFSRREKRKPQTVDIENEINRIAKYMWEYEGRIEMIVADKIFITEGDYNAISKGLTKVITEVVAGQTDDINQQIRAISKGQNIVSRIIDKVYEVDWSY